MPRKPRFIIPNVPVHIVQRSHSRNPIFFEDSDYSAYLYWLKTGAERYRVSIHAYVLMTKHIHILRTSSDTTDVMLVGMRMNPIYAIFVHHFKPARH